MVAGIAPISSVSSPAQPDIVTEGDHHHPVDCTFIEVGVYGHLFSRIILLTQPLSFPFICHSTSSSFILLFCSALPRSHHQELCKSTRFNFILKLLSCRHSQSSTAIKCKRLSSIALLLFTTGLSLLYRGRDSLTNRRRRRKKNNKIPCQ